MDVIATTANAFRRARMRIDAGRQTRTEEVALPVSSVAGASERPEPADRSRPGSEASGHEQTGRRYAHYVTHDSTFWVRRHVETIEIMSATFARRRLTIDIQLPADPSLADPADDESFLIPVASLRKQPATSNVDLRDEAGTALPLLTRDENAAISCGAIAAATERLLPQPPSTILSSALHDLAVTDGAEADFALSLAQMALREEQGGTTTEEGQAFDSALRSMTGNSWLWLRLRGKPGGRRIVKFGYDIELHHPRLRPRRPGARGYLVWAEETKTVYRFDLIDQGDGNPRSALSRATARLASSSGFAAYDLFIETPYISGSATYHLQVDSPPGVETRGVRLLARLEPGGMVETWHRDHGTHLYLNNVKIREMFPAVVTLRVGRRGFLTLSWLSAMFIVSLLWAFSASGAKATEHPEPAAAALLIVPTVLVALSVRPGEHPVATRLLAGVRVLVATIGVLAIAAAAAVANVRPAGWNTPHTWFVYAIAASVIGGFLTLSWVLSWETIHRGVEYAHQKWRSRGFYFASCLLVVILSAGVVTVAWARPSTVAGLDGVFIAGLALLTALALFAAGTYERVDLPRSAIPVALLVGLVAASDAAATSALVLHLTAGWSWQPTLRVSAYALWGCLLAFAIQELVVRGTSRAAS
jgi:hypothetical protein